MPRRRTARFWLLSFALTWVFPADLPAAPQTFDEQISDSYGPAASFDDLAFQSENGTWLSIGGPGGGFGTAHSAPQVLSSCGVEPRSAAQRTSLTVRFASPAKAADFWLTGTFHDTTIRAYDKNEALLATVVQTYPQTGPTAPDGSPWDVYYDAAVNHVQVAASGIAALRIQPSEYDCFSIDDVCWLPDADPSQPLVTFEYPGYALESIAPDLIAHTGTASGGHDAQGAYYFPSKLAGQAGTVIRRTLPTGTTELFARVNGAYALNDLDFDPDGNLVLALQALGCPAAGTAPLALVRVTGFTAPVPPEPVATPAISPAGGTFTAPVQVTLSTATAAAEIRYTLDGSAPTGTSTLYAGPVTVSATATLKARAFKAGQPDSAVASATFTINIPPPPPAVLTIPAASTSNRSSGWIVAGTELLYWNANSWLEYAVDFGAGGTRTFSVTATNENNESAPNLPSGYNFKLSLLVDGVNKGTVNVPGSTTVYRTGGLTASFPAGVHTVRLTWTNDAWSTGVYDANIRVKEIAVAP